MCTLQETNISPKKCHFEDDFPFPKVGYVNPLEGNSFTKKTNKQANNERKKDMKDTNKQEPSVASCFREKTPDVLECGCIFEAS